METREYIPVVVLCTQYKVELSFFEDLDEVGLIELISREKAFYIHQDMINDVEKMIRIHHELNVNIEGIDVVFNLLQKVDDLQIRLNDLQNKLRYYENE